MGAACCNNSDELSNVLRESSEAAEVHAKLRKIMEEKPYLARKVHPLHHWIERCETALKQKRVAEAKDHLGRIEASVASDILCLKDAFDKFDLNRSGALEVEEFEHFVTYVGFGTSIVSNVLRETDRDANGVITLDEFDMFVGRVGGIHTMFQQVRDTVAKTADGVVSELLVGSRVRAYYDDDGVKSAGLWDARVVETSTDGCTVKLEFGTGKLKKEQTVPREWVAEDLDLVSALCSIGILQDAQHFWTILLPPSEQYAVTALTTCQTQAVFGVRQQAMDNHNKAVAQLMQRCKDLSISSGEIWAVLSWVRDLAPILVHVDLDAVGQFLEQDTHYRNQFETGTSKGLLLPHKREEWERNLFGTSYDNAAPFERPKYGVLDVMNDHRGVLCARDYGDSYLVLKNARLRCTFAPVDSGGICGSRLAVLDQYAHVLLEFSDDELREVVRVANAKEGSVDRIGDSAKLEGFNYKEAQIHGELDLAKHVKRLVVHPRHLVDGFDEERIRKVCDKHGWEFLWMHEEKKRRIYEDRESRDSSALEMSWASQDYISLADDHISKRGTGE